MRKNEEYERARVFIKERVDHYCVKYGFKINKIRIKNQKTRWGSCSSLKNLNFNYKVIYLPFELADYIVFHELCHLEQMNHSKKYWKLVEREFPNYKILRTRIRTFEKNLIQ